MTFEFKPWNGEYDPKEPILDIKEPPCRYCKYWFPQAIFLPIQGGYRQDSVRLCWEREMFKDFSCFELKEGA